MAAELQAVALFVTSPDGNADGERPQAGFAALRMYAPVIRVIVTGSLVPGARNRRCHHSTVPI